jgi:hypothetical protein
MAQAMACQECHLPAIQRAEHDRGTRFAKGCVQLVLFDIGEALHAIEA